MRLPSVPTQPMVDHLNSAYFNSVWNAVDNHGRANFPLEKVARRVQVGAVPVNQSVVGLPTTDKVYAVYKVSPNVFGRFVNLTPNVWLSDLDILGNNNVTLTVYSTKGRMIPSGQIHIRYDQYKSFVLIAITKEFTSACIGESYPELYATINFDTSRETHVTNFLWRVSNAVSGTGSATKVRQDIINVASTCPKGTMVFINGWFHDIDHLPNLAVGDIVDLTCDPDIVGYCDISIDDALTGYYSNLYKEYREILHIPKSLNPDNVVITNDTVELVIFDNITKRGVYGHRIDAHALESVTHNDFSMGRSVLQSFQDALGSQGISVRLYVRMPSRHITLGREVNQIKDLYFFDDAEISRQLVNLSSKQIVEWKADHLEQSSYLTLIYDFKGFVTNNLLAKYAEAFGYYGVAATLSESIHRYTHQGGEVVINKPTRLIGYPIEVIVYADGRKLPASVPNVTSQTNTTFTLSFDAGSYVTIGSKITVYVTEGGTRDIKTFNPTAQSPTITLDNEDYDLVEIFSYGQPKKVWDETVTKGYSVLQRSNGNYQITYNPNGSVTFKVSPAHYNKHFYLVPVCALSTSSYPLDNTLLYREPIIIPLHALDESGNIIPQIFPRALEVYINGYRLSEGLDYSLSPVLGDHNDVLQTLLLVSSSEYLDFDSLGNTLEVVIHGDKAVSLDQGYVISDMMYRATPPMLWNKACGRVYAKGLLLSDVTESGNTLISPTPLDDGIPYIAEWSLPFSVAKLMQNIPSSPDSNLRARISGILGLVPPTYPDTVLLFDLYSLYSPYLAKIVSDVAAGRYTIINDPQDNLFLNQFSAYAVLFPRDPVLDTTNRLIDRRFVTLAAHYANFSIQDPEQMLLVQRLITLLLTPSELSIEEVLI